MAIRGERFNIDWSDEEDSTESHRVEQAPVLGEIKERSSTAPPSAPKLPTSQTGFPAHKKRYQSSKFRQSKSGPTVNANVRPGMKASDTDTIGGKAPLSDRAIVHGLQQEYGSKANEKEKVEIDAENKRRIAEMSTEEIEDARSELMAKLNPGLIRKLMRKSKAKENNQSSTDAVRYTTDDLPLSDKQPSSKQSLTTRPSRPAKATPESTYEPLAYSEPSPGPPIHFPPPPRSSSDYVPLDPSSPNFLQDLHEHYFPNTPHDPGSMAWLNDPTESEISSSTYHPSQSSLPISQVRFSFRGAIIPPKESLNIPPTKGLHHHGLDPASAGYTIPELALLARSTFPAQRCVAWQVLGRLLYQLGKGEFGAELTDDLWGVVEKERVIGVMMQEANSKTGHKSAQTYATEALWLWRQGGGGERGLKKIEEEDDEEEETVEG
ncbi:MAG: hypothetical protein Q9160_000818 [Pyrenula sp. 1 TL-2023]